MESPHTTHLRLRVTDHVDVCGGSGGYGVSRGEGFLPPPAELFYVASETGYPLK